MTTIDVPIDRGPVAVLGALELEQTGSGLVPRRLPAWTRPELRDSMMERVVAIPSGVRLAFRSSASVLELEAAVPREDPRTGAPFSSPARFDLAVDGGPATTRTLDDGATTVSFDALPAVEKEIELWLPQDRRVELRRLRADAPVEAPRVRRPRWIHYGSSISQCRTAFSPTCTWPALAARRMGLDLLNLGFGGSCHLDRFVARTIAAEPADAISIKVGVNIAAQDTLDLRAFAPALDAFLETLREGHPNVPLVVISPVICPLLEDRAGPLRRDPEGRASVSSTPGEGLTLRRLREEIERIVEGRARRDPAISYLDGLELFGPGDVDDLPDGLHPNGDGYLRIGERFSRLVRFD